MPYHFHGETRTLDAVARQGVSGSFVTLPEGVTHYELGGSPTGQPVVLVHGFSVPYYIWDPTFPALAEAGLRPLRYDLFGRGYSDRPETAYTLDLFDRQLLGLLDALDLSQPVDLVGLSMGGPIVTCFADRHPERVRRVAWIDPAGLPFQKAAMALVGRLGVVGAWLFDLLFERFMVKAQGNDFVHPERFLDFRDKYLPQTAFIGFRQAIFATLRGDVLKDHTDIFQRVGASGRPALAIWGRLDKTIPFPTHEKLLRAVPQAEFHAIDDAGHTPHYERPEIVNPVLIHFHLRA